MLILVGPSASGKTQILKLLIQNLNVCSMDIVEKISNLYN